MQNANLLVAAMAEKCKDLILQWDAPCPDLPRPLQPKHLLWMCKKIEEHAEDAPATKLHRWIGFIQCAMMANGMLDLDGAKAMFDRVKVAYREGGEDLLDHLDPTSHFELDIGGEG
jgi:hypothetical protein